MTEETDRGDGTRASGRDLRGRVAVIVGAGQTQGETIGNGRATAVLFARAGAQVVLVDRDATSAGATRRMILDEPDTHPDPSVQAADVLVEDDCRRVVADTVARFGRVDILHYNVGRSEGDAEVAALDQRQWDEIMNLNARGFYLCAKHALPVMRSQNAGVITAISSAAALASGRNMTYKASKAAMNALVQSMAVDNGKYGIRVNAILPGLMDTPMAIERRAREQGVDRATIREQRDRMVPLNRRMGTAWDVARCALFLASDDAAYISGVALPVDGGLTARVG